MVDKRILAIFDIQTHSCFFNIIRRFIIFMLFFAILVVCFGLYCIAPKVEKAIAKREFCYLLRSLMGYFMFLGQTLVGGYLYRSALERFSHLPPVSPYTTAPLLALFHPASMAIVLWLMIPALTMRLIAEERSTGTWELLATYAIPDWQFVLGKFFGVWMYYQILWIPALLYLLCLSMQGYLDIGQISATYVYLNLSGAAFLAIGVLSSSLVKSQLAAWSISFIALFPSFGFTLFDIKYAGLSSWFEESLNQALRGTLTNFIIALYVSIAGASLAIATMVMAGHRLFAGFSWKRHSREILFIGIICLCSIGVFLIRWPFGLRILCILLILGIANIFAKIQTYLAMRWVISILLILTSAITFCLLGYHINTCLDISYTRAFSLHPHIQKVLSAEIPSGENIHAIAFVAYHEQHQHEHTERDNERFFILSDVLRKFAESLNRAGEMRFSYEFLAPAPSQQSVANYLQQEHAIQERLSQLQNRYGVTGYRELILLYQGRCYILSDPELFIRKLLPEQVPQLCLLWRRIYESGGIATPPPEHPEQALAQLQEIGNPEMFSIFPHPNLEGNLANGILHILRDDSPCIYFTQGQGELAIQGHTSQDYKTAYRLADHLRRQNLKIRPLLWQKTSQIPDDCSALVVLGSDARLPLLPSQVNMIKNYLHQQGKLLLCLTPESDPSWSQLLAEYQLSQESGMLVQHYWGKNRQPQTSPNFEVELPTSMIAQSEKVHSDTLEVPTILVSQVSPIILDTSLPKQHLASPPTPLFALAPTIGPTVDVEKNKQRAHYYLGWIVQGVHHEQVIILATCSFTSDMPFYHADMNSPLPYILVAHNQFVIPQLLKLFLIPFETEQAILTTEPIQFTPSKIFNRGLYPYVHWIIAILCIISGGCFIRQS